MLNVETLIEAVFSRVIRSDKKTNPNFVGDNKKPYKRYLIAHKTHTQTHARRVDLILVVDCAIVYGIPRKWNHAQGILDTLLVAAAVNKNKNIKKINVRVDKRERHKKKKKIYSTRFAGRPRVVVFLPNFGSKKFNSIQSLYFFFFFLSYVCTLTMTYIPTLPGHKLPRRTWWQLVLCIKHTLTHTHAYEKKF